MLFCLLPRNSSDATGLFLYLVKSWENQRFCNVFSGYRKLPVVWNGLSFFSEKVKLKLGMMTVPSSSSSPLTSGDNFSIGIYLVYFTEQRQNNALKSVVIVCTPLFLLGGGGEPPIYFSKGRLDRTSIFIGGVAGKEGGDFFRDNCNFYIKNKLKS